MKKLLILAMIMFAFSTLTSNQASAYGMSSSSSGLKFNPSVMYLYESQTGSNGSGNNTSRYLADLSLGYLFSNSPFYAGAIYSYDSKVLTGNSAAKDTYTSYGGTIGVLTENIYMLFSYFLSSQYDQVDSTGRSTTSYTGGSGFKVALGYLFTISSGVQLGPELSYRSLAYTQVKSPSGTTSTASLTYNTLLPYVSLFFSL